MSILTHLNRAEPFNILNRRMVFVMIINLQNDFVSPLFPVIVRYLFYAKFTSFDE